AGTAISRRLGASRLHPRAVVPDGDEQAVVPHPRLVDEDEAAAVAVVVPDLVGLRAVVERVALDHVRLTEADEDLAAVGVPAGVAHPAVLLVGVGDAVVVLLHPLVAAGAGRGGAAVPTRLDTGDLPPGGRRASHDAEH